MSEEGREILRERWNYVRVHIEFEAGDGGREGVAMKRIRITSVQLSQCWRIDATLMHFFNREGLEGSEDIPIGSVVWEVLDLKASDRRWNEGGDWAIAPQVVATTKDQVFDCGGEVLVAFRGEIRYSELLEGWRPCWESEVGVWVDCYIGCRVNI